MDDKPNRRRPRDEDEDDRDERPSRRRSRDEDEDDRDDRPRRRRRDDEEDEGPVRPRARRRSEPSQQSMDLRVKLLIGGVILGVVLLGVGIWLVARAVNRSPFRNDLPTYLASPAGAAGPLGPRATGKKMVVVDMGDQDIASLHFDLPERVRARTPEEVGLVAQIRWDKQQVGTYSSGGAAYRWSCAVSVMDKSTRALIATTTITGNPPPSSIRGRRGQSHSGDKPTAQVVQFLSGF